MMVLLCWSRYCALSQVSAGWLLSVLGCTLTALSDWFSSVLAEAVIQTGTATMTQPDILFVPFQQFQMKLNILLPPYLIKQD